MNAISLLVSCGGVFFTLGYKSGAMENLLREA